ncbi:zinc-binding dehydrogenase [Streptomyces sp. NPDC008001]|uniref:zinc-dependent alcohol dehydrogenase n=1 Tax=Streptomyces sp. NPDC008001 TaxID=3364804 RepID=UPI0036E1B6BE
MKHTHSGPGPAELVLAGPGRLRILPVEPPSATGPDEVVVQVDCVSLCGSDYRLYHGTYGGPRTYPIRFGHEWAGVVVAAGSGASHLLGQAVTGDCSRWCGQCDQCRSDRNLCRHIEKFGLTMDGFSSRYVRVPARYLYPDPYPLPPEVRALAEPFAVALKGLRQAPLARSAPVLIIGAGALGMAVYLLVTREKPALQVHLLETDQLKVKCLTQRIPALTWHDPLHPSGPGSASTTYASTAALARYPLVIECAGAGESLNTALQLADLGGTVLCFGLTHTTRIRSGLLITKGLTLLGSVGGTGAFPQAMHFLKRHAEDARLLLTHSYPAHHAHEAFRTKARARIKAQITFDD